jgi:acetyl-CoA carboxylase biotin carboxyl carrier protein
MRPQVRWRPAAAADAAQAGARIFVQTGGRQRPGTKSARSVAVTVGDAMARIEIKSEITGTVWQVKSQPGDRVEEGDILVVIESMKMEIPVITEDAGTVKEILVKEKDPVAEGQVVAIIED